MKKSKDFLRSECKLCRKQKIKSKNNNGPKIIRVGFKICNKCSAEQTDSEFRLKSNTCKSCNNYDNKIWRTQYKEHLKEYCLLNKEKHARSQNNWIKNNIVHIRESRNKHISIRRKIDPIFKLRTDISRSILQLLKRNNSNKNGNSCLKHLPYSIDDLKNHLESKFESWMSWDNHGVYNRQLWNDNDPLTWTWQIDHIIPKSLLPHTDMNDDNFIKCWQLSNLRPLSSKQNVIEGTNKIRH